MEGPTVIMIEEHYSVRQIEEKFKVQTDDLKEHMGLLINPLTAQVTKTNGTVQWQTKMLYMGLGALFLLVPWAGWVTTELLQRESKNITQEDLDRAVDKAVQNHLEEF